MNQLDVFYRALLNYRTETLNSRECLAQRNAIAKVNTDSDSIVLTRNICTVDEDWVIAIEKGLIHVEKAIKEERQFIRSNGEVIPIEKVKQVSKDSVEHLARHSNLLTRVVEGEDLIPDELYTVERLSDYAVYENRFLYMLLCYLRDFITLRYNKIVQASNTYDGKMTMNKVINMNKQTIKYEVKLEEERRDDAYLKEHNSAKDIIDRIDLLLKTVLAFLATPLMQYASKAPMLKPPITKTNVLKMNNNFKGALALYGFVTAYDKPGYTIETKVTEMSPFREMVADEMAETILLSSFLTYEYSLDMREDLKKSYEEEEERRKEQEYKEFLEKLEKIRRKVQKSGQNFEEYILMLEKQIRILENKCLQLDAALEEIERLKEALAAAEEQIALLTAELESVKEELEYQKRKYIEDMAALKAEYEEKIRLLNEAHEEEVRKLNETIEAMRIAHEEEIRALNEAHAEEIRQLNEAHEEEIRALTESYENQIAELKQAHADEIAALISAHEAEIEELNNAHAAEIESLNEAHEAYVQQLNEEHANEIDRINAAHAEETDRLNSIIVDQQNEIDEEKSKHEMHLEAMRNAHKAEVADIVEKNTGVVNALKEENSDQSKLIAELEAEKERLLKENSLLRSQNYALRYERGIAIEEKDFTTKDDFNDLEHDFEVFKRFYNAEWKNTKKSIRREILGKKKKAKANKIDIDDSNGTDAGSDVDG